jgi:hypothetical protein
MAVPRDIYFFHKEGLRHSEIEQYPCVIPVVF